MCVVKVVSTDNCWYQLAKLDAQTMPFVSFMRMHILSTMVSMSTKLHATFCSVDKSVLFYDYRVFPFVWNIRINLCIFSSRSIHFFFPICTQKGRNFPFFFFFFSFECFMLYVIILALLLTASKVMFFLPKSHNLPSS